MPLGKNRWNLIMNEVLFFLHVAWVSAVAYLCRKQPASVQIALMVTFALLGNLMVLKQMLLFGYSVTTADVYAVGVILVLNYIREAYDNAHVYQAMQYSFGALALLALAAYFQVAYTPTMDDPISAAYAQIMAKFPKIVMVSAIVYWVVQYLDNKLFSWMRSKLGDRLFLMRVTLSLIFSQLLDTVLFTLFALDDIAYSLIDIIIFSSCVKIGCSLLMVLNTSINQKLASFLK